MTLSSGNEKLLAKLRQIYGKLKVMDKRDQAKALNRLVISLILFSAL